MLYGEAQVDHPSQMTFSWAKVEEKRPIPKNILVAASEVAGANLRGKEQG